VVLPVFKTGGRLFEATVCSTHTHFRHKASNNGCSMNWVFTNMAMVSRKSTVPLLVSFLLAIASLACMVYPLYVIRPFRHQGARELAAALFVKQVGPVASIVFGLLGMAMVWFVWSNSRKWLPRATAVVLALLGIAGAYLARVNVYELMFHPIDSPRFDSAEKVKIASDDMVIAVKVKDERRAYPIREMAYHHVVNDTLAGEPIAATY
jgi:uncharacterized protein DUF3179